MSDYSNVKVGKLKLKGEKSHKKYKSKKRHHEAGESGSQLSSSEADTQNHGGWWCTSALSEIVGSVAVQVGELPVYVRALDNGLFTLGAPHDQGDGPAPEEVFTSVPAGESHIALKSGYGKYLGVDKQGRIVGRADAIGPKEMWSPIFQDGKTALLAANDCFVGVDDDDNIIALNKKAEKENMIAIRCHNLRDWEKGPDRAPEEKGSLKAVEENYVRKFQKFQDKRLRMCHADRGELRQAREEGTLHEALLDRRSKMKADRYCK